MSCAETVFGQITARRYAQQTATGTALLGVSHYRSLEEAKAGARQELQAS